MTAKRLPSSSLQPFCRVLKRHRITHVVLAGAISRRPAWRAVRPSVSLLRILPRALAALTRGDDGLLRILVDTIEDNGIKVVGAHQIVPDLLAMVGRMGAHAPMKSDWADLNAGLEAAARHRCAGHRPGSGRHWRPRHRA